MKQNIIKKFNLPSYIKDKSFAEASKLIESKFKDRDDKVSNDTKKILLERLAEAQEFVKQSETSSQNINNFATGGNITDATNGIGGKNPLSLMTTGLDLANTAFGDNNIDTSGVTNVNPNDINVTGGTINSALKGAQAGMQFGPLGAGIGGIIGGAAGLIGGSKAKKDAIKAKGNYDVSQAMNNINTFMEGGKLKNNTEPDPDKVKKNNKLLKEATDIIFTGSNPLNTFEQTNKPDKLNLGKYSDLGYFNITMNGQKYNVNKTDKNPYNYTAYKQALDYISDLNPNANLESSRNTYKKGGYTNNYPDGGIMDEFDRLEEMDTLQVPLLKQTGLKADDSSSIINNNIQTLNQEEIKGPSLLRRITDDINKEDISKITDTALRFAPAIGNGLQLLNMNKPEVETLAKIDNKYNKDLFDEQSLINNINSSFNNNFLKEASAGSLGSYMNNSQAAQLNKARAISEGVQRGDQINRQENIREQDFNNRNDILNVNLINQEKDINARNRASYDNNKSRLFSQLANDIGNIGREQKFKQMVKDSGLCYDSSGAYICGTNTRLSKEELASIKTETNNNSKGGMLNSNSMFTSYLEYLKNK